MVQASQEERQEDTDIEPLPANQPTSSPPCPIPENLVRYLPLYLDPNSRRHAGLDGLAQAETWRSSVVAQRQVGRDSAPRARVG